MGGALVVCLGLAAAVAARQYAKPSGLMRGRSKEVLYTNAMQERSDKSSTRKHSWRSPKPKTGSGMEETSFNMSQVPPQQRASQDQVRQASQKHGLRQEVI